MTTTGGENQPVVSTVSILQIWDMVREQAELTPEEMEEVPLVQTLVVSREVQWTVGKPVPGIRKPGENEMMVFALFHGPDDHDVTVYALPRDAKPVNERAWARYIVNRVAPTMSIETMVRRTFMAEAANDLYNLAFGDDEDEEEEEEETETPAEKSVPALTAIEGGAGTPPSP